MALKRVRIYYGGGYENSLDLNDNASYVANTAGLFDNPEVDALQGQPVYERPFETRGKLKERVFSIQVSILAQNFSNVYNDLLNNLKKACNSDFEKTIRVEVERTLSGGDPGPTVRTVYMYVTAKCEKITQDRPGVYTALFKAADPIFTKSGTSFQQNRQLLGSSASGSLATNTYSPIPMPYDGTYPAEPKLTFTTFVGGGVWRYYRDVYVTNRSANTLLYYPLCITLGDIHLDVGTKYNVVGGGDNTIKDIRIESQGGARKLCWVRDVSNTHTDVRLWTIIYSLRPGETKVLRVLYGNPNCTADSTANYDNIRPMFNMFTSGNSRWDYGDFLPLWTVAQSRAFQWQPYAPAHYNLNWIRFAHPHFDNSTGNVPCGGGKVDYHSPTNGVAGVNLSTPVPLSRLTGGWRLSTNAKDPFCIRRTTADGRVDDIYQYPPAETPPGATHQKAQLTTTSSSTAVGNNVIHLTSISGGSPVSTIATGDTLIVLQDNGTILRDISGGSPTYALPIVTGVSGNNVTISLNATANISAGNSVQQQFTGTVDISWAGVDEPISLAFVMRSDVNTQDSGEWYYGAMEYCTIFFDTSQYPSVGSAPATNDGWAGCAPFERDTQAGVIYQVRGMFGNVVLGEYITVSTILPNIGDRIILDCAERSCYYYRVSYTSLTASAVSGSLVLSLVDATQFLVGTQVWVNLDNGGIFRSTVTAKSGNNITLLDALSASASGNRAVGVWENRFECLDTGTPRRYWVHIDPDQTNQSIQFIPDANSNFANIRVDLEYPTLYM